MATLGSWRFNGFFGLELGKARRSELLTHLEAIRETLGRLEQLLTQAVRLSGGGANIAPPDGLRTRPGKAPAKGASGGPRLLTIAEVAEAMHISVRSIYHMIARRQIAVVHPGGMKSPRITEAECERIIREGTIPVATYWKDGGRHGR